MRLVRIGRHTINLDQMTNATWSRNTPELYVEFAAMNNDEQADITLQGDDAYKFDEYLQKVAEHIIHTRRTD